MDLFGEDGFRTRAAQRVIAALPVEQQEVLALVCVLNMSYQEAADFLGVHVEVVIARLLQARRTIIAVMDGID